MNITTRTCANCAAFNPDEGATTPECWNLVSFIVAPGRSRAPVATDLCSDHLTHAEDVAETALIEDAREHGGMEQATKAVLAIASARAVIRRAQR